MDVMILSGRHARLSGLIAGAILIIAVVLFGHLPGETLLWRELQNTGHIPLFGLLAIALLFIQRESTLYSDGRPLAGYLIAAGLSLVIGITVEFGQRLTKHHEPSIADAAYDLAGILIALGICAGLDPRMAPVWSRMRPGLRGAMIILAGGVFLACLFPVLDLANAYRERAAAMPVIMDFTAGWVRPFLQLRHASLSTDVPADVPQDVPDGRFATLRLKPGKYPGVSIVEPYSDWTGHASLAFEVYSPEPSPVNLVLRVHDRIHNQSHSDRFTRRLVIKPGENRFHIPLAVIETAPAGRHMDMSRIAGLILYVTDISRPLTLYLGTWRLEG
jgi:hypothetical protein